MLILNGFSVSLILGVGIMNLHITGLHIEVTNAMREYVEKKMSRINRHSDGLISVNITLSAENAAQSRRTSTFGGQRFAR